MKSKNYEFNLLYLNKGGIYCILCLKNGKHYIGESASFLERAVRHWTLLKNNKHECLNLQKDFGLYGKEAFEFNILCFERHNTMVHGVPSTMTTLR